MNIILCGFKNCGKSTVGKALAKALHYHFDDTDALLEKYYFQENNDILTTAQIYNKHGRDLFRQLESDIVQRLEKLDKRVIALGGGTVLNPDNVVHLQHIGTIIYLRASKDLLKNRMLKTRIPEFIDKNAPQDGFDKVYLERYKIYEEIADVIIDVDEKTVDSIVKEIEIALSLRV